VLARFTGSDRFGATATVAAGSSRVEPGVTPAADVTLSWPTFTDAAAEAGRSRRYGGIHFTAGDLAGRALGGMVGARAWQAAAALFAGPRKARQAAA
jgi:VCPO second helical-bundle domain